MFIRGNKLISLNEAKIVLGEEAAEMSDQEIQQLIDDFDVIAQYSIKMVQKFDDKNKLQME